jgi:hypothetical protein
MTNWLVLSAGILAAVTTLIHLIFGGKDVVRPLLASSIDDVVKLTLYACWHLVSAALFLSSMALIWNGIGLYQSPETIAFVSIMWLTFGSVFLAITLGVARPSGIFRLPQWALLVPVGLLGLWGLV